MSIERYARAATSSNLKNDDKNFACDELGAMAHTDMSPGSHAMAGLLFRVKFVNDTSSYPELVNRWRGVVLKKAADRKWPTHLSPKKIAGIALDQFLFDVCPICSGKRFTPVDGVPNVLSDDECSACRGTGKKPLKCEHNERKSVQDMIELLGNIEKFAAIEQKRRLRAD